MTAIECRNLTFRHEGDEGLFDFSCAVGEGQAYAVLAPAGGGKTTLFSLLFGMARPESGSCTVCGKDCFRDRLAVRGLASFVPGYAALPPHADGDRYLAMLRLWQGGAQADRLRSLMERLDITPMGRFARMQGDMRAKMALLFALMRDAGVLILDDPFAGLGASSQRQLAQVLKEEKKRGKTILLLTHVLKEAQALCDTIAVVRKGRTVVEQPAATLAFQREKVYHITFEDRQSADRFCVEWGGGAELMGERVMVALPGSPQTLIRTLAKYGVLDLVGGREEGEESFLRYHGDETL